MMTETCFGKMTETPFTAKDGEEAFGKVDFEKLIGDDILKKSEEELLMPASYGSRFDDIVSYEENGDKYIIVHPEVYKYLTRKQYKKIKRRIFYEISWWGAESRYTKCFYSAKKMRNFVNELHSWYNEGFIEIEKTWGYREYSPRHKWFYVSYRPNQFVCVERY